MKPNILFIFTDDQRFDTLSALGNTAIATPNLDRLAGRGTLFTQAHIMGGTSPAVCMPSRAMLMTGRTLFHLEHNGRRLPAEHTTMPEQFRRHGYQTCHVGKWHQDRESHQRSFSTGAKIFGFRRKCGWYEACNGHWHIPVHDFDPDATYAADGGCNDPPIEAYPAPYETVKEHGRHSTEVFSDAAIEFLREQSGEKPFFLYLAHIAPHDPRQYPARFRKQYNADNIELPPNFMPRHPFDNGELRIRDELLEGFPRRPAPIRQHIADYFALIAMIDEQVGRVLDALDANGQADNTIIVFAGDNGLAVGQHGLMGKQNLYDHSIRVPLILAGPGIPAGERRDAGCYLLDIFPTLCDLTDTPIPDSVEGKSLVPVLKDPSATRRDVLYFAYMGCQRAVKVGRHKLIEYAVNGTRTQQLFDLDADPNEINNLAEAAEHKDLLASLRQVLRRWQTDLDDNKEWGRQFWGANGKSSA